MNLGGTEKALLSLLTSLGNQPVKITLLLLEKGGVLSSQIPHYVEVKYLEGFEEIRPIILDPPHTTILKMLTNFSVFEAYHFLLLYFKMKRTGNWYHNFEEVLKNYPHFGSFDIAVAFAGPFDFITYFVHQKVKAKKKIQWIHFDIGKVITNFKFGKKYYPFFDKIFCVSQSVKEIFVEHFPQLENKTEVFHNIVSEIKLKKQSAVGATYEDGYDGIRILTVGRFTKEKGQHLIPKVAKKLKTEKIGFRWYLVGNGKERANVEQMALDLGVKNDLVFLGEKENPYRYMQDCDIYVQPSLHEGYGITVAEVKVFNKPIIVTDFASAKDLITNNKTGVICEISTKGIYSAVKSLLLNPDLQRRFSENLLNTAKTAKNDFAKLLN